MAALTAMSSVDQKTGAFNRVESIFRNMIEKGGKYPPSKGRYILYVSYACPWANRCLATRYLKGLEEVIDIVVVDPIFQRTRPADPTDTHEGWMFRPAPDNDGDGGGGKGVSDVNADPVFRAASVRDLYMAAMKEAGVHEDTRFTVPILFDKETKTIVNNESSEIIRFFNTEFSEFSKNPEFDLSPPELLEQINATNEETYESINNGVYKCGFARSQEAYDTAVTSLFGTLDRLDERLKTRRFLNGKRFTESDLRLYMTMIRFDEVYVVHFKCSKKAIREYAHLGGWLRDVHNTYQLGKVIRMDHIRRHYFVSHRHINPFGIVPVTSGTLKWIEESSDELDSVLATRRTLV